MSSTRRRLLEFGGASLLALVAGCTSRGTADDDTPSGATVKTRLVGPDVDRTLFDPSDVAAVGDIRDGDGQFGLPVTLTDDGAAHSSDLFRSAGVDERPGAFELVVTDHEREVTRFGVSPALAEEVVGDDWDGDVRMTFERRSEARRVQEAFACGAESAPVSCDPE